MLSQLGCCKRTGLLDCYCRRRVGCREVWSDVIPVPGVGVGVWLLLSV